MYTKLVLGYGPNKEVTVDISWSTQANEFKITFSGGNVAPNSHALMAFQLQTHLNRNHNLTEIVHILHETYQPLSSVIQLPVMPQLGVIVSTGGFYLVYLRITEIAFSSSALVLCSPSA